MGEWKMANGSMEKWNDGIMEQWNNNGTTEQYERPTSNYNQINHRAAHVYTLEKEEEDEAALK